MSGNWQKKTLFAAVVFVLAVNAAIIWRVVRHRDAVPVATPAPGGQATPRLPDSLSVSNDTRAAAEKGDARAQFDLGQWYFHGQGVVTQDVAQGIEWYRKAGDQGFAEAQYQLGILLEKGTNGPGQLELALGYYQKAAAQGHTNAQQKSRDLELALETAKKTQRESAEISQKLAREARLRGIYQRGLDRILGKHGKTSYTEAAEAFREAAEAGYHEAQLNLGLMYVSGQGVTKDYPEAAKWFQKAADQGLADAQFNLAVLYVTGRGVVRDDAKAAEWARKAAAQNQAEAQYNLAVLLAAGKGVPQDLDESAQWFRKAAEHGHPAAQSNLGVFYIQGKGFAQDPAEANKWFQRAARQGNATAQFNLGVMYSKGQGVEKDLAESFYWSSLAALQGDTEAQVNRSLIAEQLGASQIAAALKRVTAFRPQMETEPSRAPLLKLEAPPRVEPETPFGVK